jgi:hypothetical protein
MANATIQTKMQLDEPTSLQQFADGLTPVERNYLMSLIEHTGIVTPKRLPSLRIAEDTLSLQAQETLYDKMCDLHRFHPGHFYNMQADLYELL